MNIYLLPYNMGSASASALADHLGATRIRKENSKWKDAPERVVINWGCTASPNGFSCANLINDFDAVNRASNKMTSFNILSTVPGVRLPAFTNDIDVARSWITDDKAAVVCRTVLRGHSGEGIVIADTVDQVVQAPLYTKYVPKLSEFRVTVVGTKIASVSRKARRLEVPDEDINWKVRNLDGGFIYAREGEEKWDTEALSMSLKTIRGLDLDFGAVDLIYNKKKNEYTVLEVNTAPGLSGDNLEMVSSRLHQLCSERMRIYADPIKKLKRRVMAGDWNQINPQLFMVPQERDNQF